MNNTQSELADKIKLINQKIDNASKILVIASRPVDYDCLGTALEIKWFLKEIKKKEVNAYIFTEIPDSIKHFPDINLIESKYIDELDFNYYDLIILPDGNEFRQFLTNDYKKIITTVDKEKFISIDHHPTGKIESEIPESTIRVVDSCTAKVFYDYFIKPEMAKDSSLKLPKEVAQYIYMALIGDTGVFSHAIYANTFEFAQEMINYGADHYQATELTISKPMMDFTVWAIRNTTYYPEAQSTILKIDLDKKDNLKDIFGEDWEAMSLMRYYMNIFMRMIEGFPYSLVLVTTADEKSVKVIYRVKNFGAEIDLTETLAPLGFELKGHPKAGGGLLNNISLAEAEKKYLETMKAAIAAETSKEESL